MNEKEGVSQWKRYPKYKDSGVEWLGEIPEGWQIIPLNRTLSVFWDYRGKTPKKLGLDWSEQGIPAISANNVHNGKIDLIETNYGSVELFNRWMIYGRSEKGDVIMTSEAPLGSVAQIPDDNLYILSQRVILMRTDSLILINSYLSKFIESSEFQSYLLSESTGSTAIGIKMSKFRSSDILIPSISEQKTIATFLDHETTRLDTLIEKKRHQIELLQEKRAALISQAVTKGLDPTVPMKDSGVPWLGDIPEHWEVKRLKFLAQVRLGVTKGRDLSNYETITIPYLRVANVQDGYLDLTDITEIEILPEELNRFSLKKGDILMNEGGDFDKLGRGTVWSGEIEPCIHQNHVFAVRPHNIQYSNWIDLITLTDYAKKYFIVKGKQTTNLASISSTNIYELPILIPPICEIKEIHEFVKTRCKSIDNLSLKVKESIHMLIEYRSALISAAVTGKIDLRDTLPTFSEASS